jgi:hypothetical protein
MFAWILKTKPEKAGRGGDGTPPARDAGGGGGRHFEEAIEQELDAEVVDALPKKTGVSRPGAHGAVEGVAGALEHGDSSIGRASRSASTSSRHAEGIIETPVTRPGAR